MKFANNHDFAEKIRSIHRRLGPTRDPVTLRYVFDPIFSREQPGKRAYILEKLEPLARGAPI